MDSDYADQDDSDDERGEDVATPASTLTQRRKKQREIFEKWLVSHAGQEAIKPKTKDSKPLEVADEELSLSSLMSKDSLVIRNPRDYQLELFERAKKENTIAVLDTGSGKTLIAVLLLRWVIDHELEHRAAGGTPRTSFFLVASVTLAYQQSAVLKSNLDHEVTRVCGNDNADAWKKSRWLELFADNKVIVCTAAILASCLSKGYITMKEINLLIFDEAHHAKKNHDYARIVKDFYLQAQPPNRPRIFGMTASPIDAKADVVQAATELETLLHSKIATTGDVSLTGAVTRPTELLLRYSRLSQPFETDLVLATKVKYGHVHTFQPHFEKSPVIARELGSWCADQFLMEKLSEKRLRLHELSTERSFRARSAQNDERHELDAALAELKPAIAFMDDFRDQSAALAIDQSMLSSKVIELKAYLDYQFERPTSQRCIVFVDRRDTARLLASLFQRIGTEHMKSAFLIGGASEPDEDAFSVRQQVMTLIKFRGGSINCLFATSVAEEGLDVPDCNLVIRFDMYKTMIQFVQSRGRARQKNSRFVHMIEMGNSIHEQLVQEVRYQEIVMRQFSQAMPEDRKLIGSEDCLETLMAKEQGLRVYIDPTTGAKLTYNNALVYLANFVSAIPTESNEPQHPTYIVTSRGSKFICEVLLPGGGPVPLRSAIGRLCSKKTIAKRSAAFEACIELRKRLYLDEHLMPTYQKKLPAMRNALLAVSAHKTNQYLMRTKPTAWEHMRGTLPPELWVTILDFPDGLDRRCQPIALLTRTRLPDFPSFPLFLNDGRETKLRARQLQEPLQLGTSATDLQGFVRLDSQTGTPVGCNSSTFRREDIVDKLTAFTLRVFRDVFSKTFEEHAASFSYWFAPIVAKGVEAHNMRAEAAIDWETIEEVFHNDSYPWKPGTPAKTLVDRFLVDKWDGGRKFYSTAVNDTLTPLDPVPLDAAKAKHNENILGYTVSLWKKARERAVWNPNQPVIEAEKMLFRRNLLAKPEDKETQISTKAYLCPEPLTISALRPAIVVSCLTLPAIIHRFESYMIAVEACQLTGIPCEPALALEAMTKDSDHTDEHDNPAQINFKRGMGNSYERLEFLGDAFLKTATTVSTFIQNPTGNEFEMHVRRMQLLCNKNLFNVALELKLYEYIRTMAFSRRLWYPEGLKLLHGKGSNKQEESAVIKHGLAHKTIADVSEALIGAAFMSHDRPGEQWHEEQWEKAVHAVTKLTTQSGNDDPEAPDHLMENWDDYRKAYNKPAYQMATSTASQRDLVEKAAREHPYRFKHPPLLRVAFIHPSQPFSEENLPNYQRLEFLGDSLLDLASITHIFYRFPDKDPQWLTEHKMAMVSNKFLGCVCVNLGFHRHLRHAHGTLEHQITAYVTELLDAKSTAGDSRDYWTTVADPPKCLPDIVESFVGAMFIDSDFDYNVVQDFFDRHIKWYFEDMSIYDSYANNHPCTHFYNLIQVTYGCQDYALFARPIPSVDGLELDSPDVVAVVIVHDEVIAHSKGKSGRYARLRVANQAIELIEGLAPYEFRARFGCNCQHGGDVVEDGAKGTDLPRRQEVPENE